MQTVDLIELREKEAVTNRCEVGIENVHSEQTYRTKVNRKETYAGS